VGKRKKKKLYQQRYLGMDWQANTMREKDKKKRTPSFAHRNLSQNRKKEGEKK
jgi:hypothetical protein